MDSLAGHFLIASPAIMDPNFERAVVLITAHTDEGAVGVILNRCSAATVGEAVPQLAPVIDVDEPVFVGGPVNPEGVAVLAEFEDPEEAGIVVLDDVGFVALEEALEVNAPDLQRTRVFAGVAGWGPEQGAGRGLRPVQRNLLSSRGEKVGRNLEPGLHPVQPGRRPAE